MWQLDNTQIAYLSELCPDEEGCIEDFMAIYYYVNPQKSHIIRVENIKYAENYRLHREKLRYFLEGHFWKVLSCTT